LPAGWRELSARASGALTRFGPLGAAQSIAHREPGWLATAQGGFMAADVFDDDDCAVVRIEAPGMRREED